jgi:hypothetical protein
MSAASRIISLIGIGTTAGDRVWRMRAKDSTAAPFILVQSIVETQTNTHEAVATLKQSLIQISCYALTVTAAQTLSDAVVALIEGEHAAGPIYIESRREDFDDGVSPGLYRQDIDAAVWTNG